VNGKDNGQKIEKYYNEVKLFYLNIGFPNTHTQKKKKKKKKKKNNNNNSKTIIKFN